MEFIFDEHKATQAAAYLLKRDGGRMKYMKLIKLLYLADRTALIETGSPITGDRFVAMKLGPVLGRVLDLIKNPAPQAESIWQCSIACEGFDVLLVQDAAVDQLSEYSEMVLGRIFDQYGQESEWSLSDLSHLLPEWSNPGTSVLPIDPADILRDEGYGEDELRMAIDQADAVYRLRTALSELA